MKIKNLHLILIFSTLNFQFLTQSAQAQASFSAAASFPVGSNPISVISADFNGDGNADLAVVNNVSNNVSVLLGDGEGSFGIATNFAVSSSPYSVTSTDFNGDEKPDLAVANYGSNKVSVLLGDGTGSFGVAINFTVGISPTSVTSADFNTDGNADLAVSSLYNNIVSILIGDGLGGFITTNDFPVGYHPVSITSTDFNGDGNGDLAMACESSSISVLLGNGTGSFSAASNFAVGVYPTTVISADFNEDGKVDLATANQITSKISVLLGNGLGSFAATTYFEVGSGSYSLFCADFNADDNADLVVSNHNNNHLSILLGDGLGNFGTATSFSVGSSPRSVISGDFNGDSKADLAVVNSIENNVSILLNNFIPGGPPICLVTVDPTLTHNIVVWEKTNLDIAAIDSFIVYREITTNNYQRIGAVSSNSLSFFDDFSANPASTAFRYKLKNKNNQGVESLFSDYHNTMYLTHAGADFSWTPYQIENNTSPVSAYNVFRDDNATGNFQSIGSTTGNQLGFTDVNYYSYPNASYYVEAVMITGNCQPTRSDFVASRSNVKYLGIAGAQQLKSPSLINIYPTPTDNTLNISGITGKTTLQLYDVVGKLLIEKEVENNTSISIIQLAEGIYTLFSDNITGRTFNKVVISR